MSIELIAPAKLNLTLEVLGKRPDGYHEVASVMQTIDLADRIRIEPAGELTLTVLGDHTQRLPPEESDNLAMRAAVALRNEVGRPDLGASISLEKYIPAAMGLGGGSSDAAAVLRGLNHFWGLDLDLGRLSGIAAGLGSDVTFFLHAGTAVVGGRGEIVKSLPDVEPFPLTLFLSDVEVPDKTRLAYSLLEPLDLTDGGKARAAVEALRNARPLTATAFFNVFDRHLAELAPQSGRAMTACRQARIAVFACGSGPAFFAPTPIDSLHEYLLEGLRLECGVRAVAGRTLSRTAALALNEE